MSSTQRLLREIEAFISRVGITESAFGQLSAGNRRLVRSLREGRSVTLHTADAIRLFMQTYKPRRSPRRGNGRRNEPRASAA